MAEFKGTPNGEGRRIAVIVSRFNEEVTAKLLEGAVECLIRHGVRFQDVDVHWVPGAWELPPVAARVLATDRYDAIVAVGAVIRGETPHFDYVAGECARGLADLQREFGVSVGFGVLTTDTDAQAEALTRMPRDLFFQSLTAVTDRQAELFGGYRGRLSLAGITSL